MLDKKTEKILKKLESKITSLQRDNSNAVVSFGFFLDTTDIFVLAKNLKASAWFFHAQMLREQKRARK